MLHSPLENGEIFCVIEGKDLHFGVVNVNFIYKKGRYLLSFAIDLFLGNIKDDFIVEQRRVILVVEEEKIYFKKDIRPTKRPDIFDFEPLTTEELKED